MDEQATTGAVSGTRGRGPVTIEDVRAKLLTEAAMLGSDIVRDHTLHLWPWADAERILTGEFPITYGDAPSPSMLTEPRIIGAHLLKFHADAGAMSKLAQLALLVRLARWAGADDAAIRAMLSRHRERMAELRQEMEDRGL